MPVLAATNYWQRRFFNFGSGCSVRIGGWNWIGQWSEMENTVCGSIWVLIGGGCVHCGILSTASVTEHARQA